MNKILIIGYARSGKDTLAEILRDEFGMTFKSSSYAAAEIFIFDALRFMYDYDTVQECFEDRHDKRDLWYNMICEYNREDPTRLAREILKDNDCYVGMRSDREIKACIEAGLFEHIIWVDASQRIEKESEKSCSLSDQYANIIISNNGTLEEFEEECRKLGRVLR